MSAVHHLSRRAVLKGAVALAAVPSVAAFTGRRLSPVRVDPFTLGVASGDPGPNGVVIWTRLAPNPLADDGFGGMPARAFEVEWEVAADESFIRIEQRGLITAAPEFGHSVHVELVGLQPARDYFYRFRVDGHLSPTGRNRDRIMAGLVNSSVRNAVVLTGDVHSNWAAEVRENFDDPSSKQVATEFVTTSISACGDGSDIRDEIEAVLPENPHIRYYSNRRGYVRTRIAHGELRADFPVLPFVSRPDAPAYTGASYVLTDRASVLDAV